MRITNINARLSHYRRMAYAYRPTGYAYAFAGLGKTEEEREAARAEVLRKHRLYSHGAEVLA